jgi:hypothetical protein
MAIFLTIVMLVLTNAVTVFLLVRAARRLLQFDEIFSGILPVLTDYSVDLARMTKGDLLLDNPEVLKFHKRNMNALANIEMITKEITEVAPPRPKRDTKLPAPDVE